MFTASMVRRLANAPQPSAQAPPKLPTEYFCMSCYNPKQVLGWTYGV